jgi:hypothetical protein
VGRVYSAVFETVSVSAAQDLFELNAPSDACVVVHGFEVSQVASETSEQLNLLVHRGTTSGSGGTTVTARPLKVGDPAFGGTVEVNNTTQSSEGNQLHAAGFNVLNGYLWLPPPELRPVLSPSGRLVVELQTAPGAALSCSGTLYFEEVGG